MERFSGKSVNGLTNQPTIRSLTSTDVENCNAGDLHALRQSEEDRQSTQSTWNAQGTQNLQERLVVSKYAISSWTNGPHSRKWSKNPFLAFWIIQKGIFVISEWSSMGDMTPRVSRSFSIIKICNLKSIWGTKLEQDKPKAESSVFGRKWLSLGHLLRKKNRKS